MINCPFETAREGFTALLPTEVKQLIMGELGRAKIKKALTLFLTVVMLAEIFVALSPIPVGAPPDGQPVLYSPTDGTITNDNTPTFEWTVGANADNHRLLVDNDSDFLSPEENVLLGAIDNTYTPTTGLADENYSWKVIAINAAGENESTTWTFLIDTVAPAAPSLLEPADGMTTNDNTIIFRWTVVTDQSGVTYTIQVDNDPDFTSPDVDISGLTDNVYTPSDLPDENYSWRVRAVDGAGNIGDWSSIWTLLIDTVPPAAPTLILPADEENINDNTPNLDWNAVSENSLPVTYDIWVDNDFDFSSPIVSATGVTDDNYQVTTDLAEGVWQWRVRAVDNAGNIGDNSQRSFMVDVTPPVAPTLLEPLDGAKINDNTPTFRWIEVTDASGVTYTIQVDNDPDFNSPEVNVSGLTENIYIPSALADENYSWRVRAVDNAGNVGDWSSVWTVLIDTIAPAAPSLISPEDGTTTNDNAPTFRWTELTDASGVTYILHVDNDPSFTSPEINVSGLADNAYTPITDLADENYSWHVRAVDGAGNLGDWSTVWTLLIDTMAPATPSQLEPSDSSLTNDNTPTFRWTAVIDPSGVTYTIQVDNDPDFTSPKVDVSGLVENTYTPSELTDDNYSWQVRAVDGANNIGNWTATWTFAIDTVPPDIPALVSPTDGTITNDNTPTFDWSDVAGAENYDLLVDNDSDFLSPEIQVTVSVSTCTPTAGLADENYSWKVRARDAANNLSDWSTIWTFVIDTVPPGTPALQSPADGTVTNDNTPTFEWSDVADAIEYRLQVDNDSNFSSPEIDALVSISTYTPAALADENYSWRTAARDSANNWSGFSPVWTLLIDTVAPTVPSLLSPGDGTLTNDNTPTFRWTSVTDPSDVTYAIQVDNDPDFSSPEVNVSGLTENTYTPSALPDENYSWQVRPVDGANNVGGWSTTWTFVIDTVPPGTPSLSSPADGTITNDNTPTFDWSDVAGGENYDLLVDNDADFSSPEIQVTVSVSAYTPSAELADENYSWKVRAQDAANNLSDWSTIWTFVIDTVPPGTPSLSSPADGTITNDNTPTFEWSDVANAIEYRLQVDNDSNFSSPEIDILVSASTYTPTAALADENYSWRVRARDSANNWSSWSSVWTFVVAVRVRAVDVSVSPSWQENIAGGSLSYAVVVTNLGEVADSLNMSVSDTLTWGLSLDNTRFENVENGGSRSTTLRATIPSTTLPSQTDNITVTVTSEGDPSKSDSENCQAHVALLRDVEVAISPSWENGPPGATLTYIVTVKNTGHLDDKYNLIPSDTRGWALKISPTELWLKAGENDTATLEVTIPWETVSSITDIITVRAEGTLAQGTPADPENVSAEATAEAHCTVVRGVDVSISPSYQSGLLGTLLTYTVTVTNTGNALDTYKLTTSDNAGWSPMVSPSSIDLWPEASGNTKLKVIVPSDAIGCTRDNILIIATSQLDNTVSNSASCIAHAVKITSHDPIHIVGNDNFTQANGVISGSGTSDDPYIIGYWDVNASSAHGIWIENTDVYFIIRNCRIYYGDGYNYGVYFNHVKNGKIESVTSRYNINGIHLRSSSNNNIEGCTTDNNSQRGIYLYSSSDNNIISNCTAKGNADGIYLYSSSNNKIEKCTTSNNVLFGIIIELSENNIVSNCDSHNNYYRYGIYIGSSDNNCIYHNNILNNAIQAYDNGSNRWDNGYPSGGNYWGDYTGSDEYRGDNQDVLGSDGIGDTPYHIPGDNNIDRYPLVSRGLKLSISPYRKEGMPGAKLSYVVTVTNTGNVADNYSLTVSDNAGWGPIITPSSLRVYPGGFANATLEVTVPENAENSDRDRISVVARSKTDNTVSAENSCIALAVIKGVTVSISPSYLSASPGAELTYTVTVINTGLVGDTYDLSTIDNGGWGPSVLPSSLWVSVGENGTATLKVTIFENATPCTEDNITVIAISQADPGISDNDSCIAHASIGPVNVLISPREIGELAGENVTFSVKVINAGNIADDYDLIVFDNLGWSLMLSENSLENVQPDENRAVTLSVAIPENAEPCTEDNITVIAISRTDPGVTDNDSCIAHVLSPKAELSLVTLYKVGLDVNLWLENGSKLVVKFYTYMGDNQGENVVWEGATPAHVTLLENVPHPLGLPIEIAALVLTTDNTAEVISTIASFTVHQGDLKGRFFEILGGWFKYPELQDAFKSEFRAILSQWFKAPP